MPWWGWTLIGLYVLGFIFTLYVNVTSFPVTAGLAWVRAVVWPLWMLSGMEWPGTPMRMD